MARVCMALIVICLINDAYAETVRTVHRSELQVGGAMRIVAIRKDGHSSNLRKEPDIRQQRGMPSLDKLLNGDNKQSKRPDTDRAQNTDMAYSLTGSLSLGVGYYFVEAEDLVGRSVMVVAEDEDHQSHHVFLRARWQFD